MRKESIMAFDHSDIDRVKHRIRHNRLCKGDRLVSALKAAANHEPCDGILSLLFANAAFDILK